MQIVDQLKAIAGSENVIDDPDMLKVYSTDTSTSTTHMANYAVKVKNTEEVRQVIQLANKNKIPVVPNSSGIHFYGNALPSPGCIILDLLKMDKVLEVDDRNKMVRVEPGVTWCQLQSQLKPYHLMALSPLFPHPRKSVLTSHLEREPMLIPKFEYGDNMVSLEVVLPEGEVFRTGSACVPGFPNQSLAKGVNPGGPGEITWSWLLQGAQGTMGIVTWAQVKIVPKPTINKTFIVPFACLGDAVRFVYSIQQRMLGEECLILNKANMASVLSTKWPDDFYRLKKTLPAWAVILVLGGGWRRPEEKIDYEEDGLRDIAAELRIPELPGSIPNLPGIEKEIPMMLRSPWPIEKDYWKFAYKGACQDLFFHTTLNCAPAFVEMIEQICGKHSYCIDDIGFYLQPLEYARACHFECNLFYDQNNAEETDKTYRLFLDAAESALNMSAFFSRPHNSLAKMIYEQASDYTVALKKLKQVFDPNNIMSPNRLCY